MCAAAVISRAMTPDERPVTRIDGMDYPRGERGGCSAFLSWYGSMFLVGLFLFWVLTLITDWLVDWLFF